MNNTKRVYFENLDGLRFFCFLSVFFFHSFYTKYDYIKDSGAYHIVKEDVFGNGNLGVNFFFVLSGFLITFLLIKEKRENGQIDIKKFWIRRILRIWPLYFFCVIFGFFIFPVIKTAFGQTPNETASIWYYLFFINNFDFIHKGLPDSSVLGVLWSVAIEEQFYLVWPVVLYFLPIKKYYLAFITVIIGSFLFRAANDNYLAHEHHTLSCIGDMAVGAFGAWAISERVKFKNMVVNLKRYQILMIYIVFLCIFFFRDDFMLSSYVMRIFERSLIAVVILFIILEQSYSDNSLFKLSNLKTVTNLGKITYGLYCLHFIGILVVTTLTNKLGINTHLWQVFFIDTPLALALTILISKLSYRYFEKPFLNLKEKFAYDNQGS